MPTPERREARLSQSALRLPRAPASARLARSHVRRAFAEFLEPVRRDDAALMTSEVVTNAIQYSDVGRIQLRAGVTENVARVEVYNEGQEWRRGPEPQPRGRDDVGGRGLFLVDKLSDRWGTDVGQALVWFEIDQPVARNESADTDQELIREVLRDRAARRSSALPRPSASAHRPQR